MDQDNARNLAEIDDADRELGERKFYRADQEAGFAEAQPHQTPQTQHPAYRLAFLSNP